MLLIITLLCSNLLPLIFACRPTIIFASLCACVLVLLPLKHNYSIEVMNGLLQKSMRSRCNTINYCFWSAWVIWEETSFHTHTHAHMLTRIHRRALTLVVQSAVHHHPQHSSNSSLCFELSMVHWTSFCLPIGIQRGTQKSTTKLVKFYGLSKESPTDVPGGFNTIVQAGLSYLCPLCLHVLPHSHTLVFFTKTSLDLVS